MKRVAPATASWMKIVSPTLFLALFVVTGLSVSAAEPATAAAPAAGREPWMVHRTAAFRIIYREDDAAAAAHVASIAEEVLERSVGFMAYRPDEPIPVVLYGDTARANGFFTPYPPHIALYVSHPAAPFLGARTPDWLEAVFVHELVHYLHLTRPIGFFGTASRVFGPLASAGSMLFLPGWAIEGPTTLAETELTAGGRGRDPFFEMEWVAPVLENRMYSYDQAGTGSVYAPRGRIYSAGYIMVDHLRDHHGEDAFIELNRSFQAWPFLGMRRALRATTGESARDFHAGMIAALQERYATRLSLPAGVATVPREAASWHLIGTGGDWVWAYRQAPEDPGSIMRRRRAAADSEAWERVTGLTPLDRFSAAVSPDGRMLAAVVVRRDAAADTNARMTSRGDLVVLQEAGDGWSPPRVVTERAHLFHPSLGQDADGRPVVVAGERDGSFSRLVEVDLETGERRTILAEPGASYATPSLSPDAAHVAATINRAGRQSVVVADRRTGRVLREFDLGGPADAEYRPRLLGAAGGTSRDGGQDGATDRPASRAGDENATAGAGGMALELWLAADAAGTLELYRLQLDTQANLLSTERMVRDQVGASDGMPLGPGRLIYASYRSDGPTLRTTAPDAAGQNADRSPARASASTPEPGPEATNRAYTGRLPSGVPILTESRPYRDWPRPILWLPLAAVAGELEGDTEFELGATLLAASTLARHDLAVSALVNTTTGYSTGMLDYLFQPGQTGLELSLVATGIGAIEAEDQSRQAGLGVDRLLWYREDGQRFGGLRARLGADYFNESGEEELQGSVAANLLSSTYSGTAQIYGGIARGVSTRLAYRPALLDRNEAGFASVTSLSAGIGRVAGWVRLLPELSFAGSTTGSAPANLPYSGATFSPEGTNALENTDYAWLGNLSLGIALPPADAAWRGFSVQQTGLRLFVEQAADGTLRPDNHSLLGLELRSTLQFNLIPLVLRGGATVRIPHTTDAGPARLQFFLGLGGAAIDQVSERSTRNRFASRVTESTRLRF